ncbi:MAG: peptide chain release factor N(5)-glutamine methyltransferase [Oscillospiraceae bacterium]|nr:peptide chain release factor N(5)-glutamine methyltransferase [Oscillospiraceae bacterium]
MARTYNELYLDMRRQLRDAGVEDFALEARRLLSQAAGYSDAELIARFYLYANDETEQLAADLLRRRISGEPLAYIAGSWDFYGMKILVNPSVLIPRIDTEALVFTALGLLRGVPEPRILDLCCGSGCIGAALAHELPNARVYLADISPEALSVARKNVALHRLGNRCVCMDADALSPPPLRMSGFDMIACNPPYIPAAELETLDRSVRDYEPILALDGGEDGLTFYRAVLEHWKSVLKDDGILIFEVGEGQAQPVRQLLIEAGFGSLGSALDTIGVERVVYGRKKKEE